MPDIGAPEIIIIAIVAILLFGAAKLPIFAKSLGESMPIFKKELKGDEQAKHATSALPPVVADAPNGASPAVVEQPTVAAPRTDGR